MQRRVLPIAALALASLLTACGGGGADSAPPVTQAKAPVALADTVSVTANQEATLDVLANDSHPDKLALELVSVGTAAHGTAALKNGALVYTPAAGYYGPDKVSYTVRAAGGSLTATADASVTVGMPLRLSGKVGVAADIGSTVAVQVGTRIFTQDVNAGAQYDVPVVLEGPEQMVTVTAQAVGAPNRHVKMISLAGNAASLYAASAGNGTLGSQQLPDLNVNLTTTAKYVVMLRINGGAAPAKQADLDAAALRVSMQEMYQIAGVLRLTSAPLLGQPALALPAGVGDTLTLAMNSATYAAFAKPIIQFQAPLLASAVTDLQEDFRSQSTLAIATDRERIVGLLPGPSGVGAAPAIELVISPNGTARLRFDMMTYALGWSKATDVFSLSPAVDPILIPNQEINGQLADLAVFSIQFRQVEGGPNKGTVTMTMSGEARYLDASPALFSRTTTLSAQAWDSLPALVAQDISGKTLAGLPDAFAAPSTFGSSQNQMRVAFAANGTATPIEHPDVGATWAITDGKLRIAFADGSVQELGRRLADGGIEYWNVRYSKDAQFQLYDALMAQAQPGLSWSSASQAAQNWRSLVEDTGMLQSQFTVNLQVDFSGTESSVNLDGSLFSSVANSWLLDSGRLITTVYRLPDNSRAGACPAGLVCTVQIRRRWTLLREDGDTVTVLDNYSNRGNDIARIIRYQRLAR